MIRFLFIFFFLFPSYLSSQDLCYNLLKSEFREDSKVITYNENKNDFKEYVNLNTSYNQGNMFISKSKVLIKEYYKTIFMWLNECEKIFGYNLKGYNKIRIYAFLAERFLPYWFNKNAKTLKWPIIFHDLNKK